jgi:hypothetical protein
MVTTTILVPLLRSVLPFVFKDELTRPESLEIEGRRERNRMFELDIVLSESRLSDSWSERRPVRSGRKQSTGSRVRRLNCCAMAIIRRFYLLLFLAVLAAGCAESHADRAQRLEPMLAKAGFRMVPASTPARQQKLNDMTPLQINYVARRGKPAYWFADPYVCNCLYVGNEQNFEQFQQLKQAGREDQAQEVTNMAEQTKYEEFMNSPAGGIFYGQ